MKRYFVERYLVREGILTEGILAEGILSEKGFFVLEGIMSGIHIKKGQTSEDL